MLIFKYSSRVQTIYTLRVCLLLSRWNKIIYQEFGNNILFRVVSLHFYPVLQHNLVLLRRRHDTETFFSTVALCERNPVVTSGILRKGSVMCFLSCQSSAVEQTVNGLLLETQSINLERCYHSVNGPLSRVVVLWWKDRIQRFLGENDVSCSLMMWMILVYQLMTIRLL